MNGKALEEIKESTLLIAGLIVGALVDHYWPPAWPFIAGTIIYSTGAVTRGVRVASNGHGKNGGST
jgi:hypothetical protein